MRTIAVVSIYVAILAIAGTPLAGFAANTVLPPKSSPAQPFDTLKDVAAPEPDASARAAIASAHEAVDRQLKAVMLRGKVAAAEGGDLTAQAWLGHYYFPSRQHLGQAEAFRWLSLAAQGGDTVSQVLLARVYDGGHGVARNRDLALKWYEKAATLGNSDAQAELCLLYVLGEERPRDIKRADSLCWLGGTAGGGKALYAQGLIFEQGLEGSPSLDHARMQYEMAAQRGNADAMDRLGVLSSDPEERTSWFRKAMASGSLAAAEHMAAIYEAQKDVMAATRLYRYGALRGSMTAQAWLDAHPAALKSLPSMLNLKYLPKKFAFVRLPPQNGLPTVETDFWDYMAQANDFYPGQAADDDVEGQSDVVCHISAQLTVTDCLPVREDPVGYGFNTAILRFLDQDIIVKVDRDDADQPLVGRDFEITFNWVLD
ncbi:tetratricopeptide repeat protein [Asticcacaulis sp. 201]|uniref:tetratricopeptide repeat protein n=1 Tax=Asticcacaulis sp. 201 TaxID=3028787 RepID=UPI00291642EA|nr:tetratricopeptide repeat protein [Asticcacaulis sp. 201]MDV6333174.1 tetratricopeptide repeat protein [Asticcacaulis sp. 201]